MTFGWARDTTLIGARADGGGDIETLYAYPGLGADMASSWSPDGGRFLMLRQPPEAAPTEIRVVLNWAEELERLVPTE